MELDYRGSMLDEFNLRFSWWCSFTEWQCLQSSAQLSINLTTVSYELELLWACWVAHIPPCFGWICVAGQRLCMFLIEHRWCVCMLIFSHFSPQLWCMSIRCIWEKCYISSGSGTFEVVLLCACHYTIVSLFRKLLIAQLLILNYACAVSFFCYELVCLSLSGWVLLVLTWVTSCRYVILSFMYGLTVSYFKTCIYALLRQWRVLHRPSIRKTRFFAVYGSVLEGERRSLNE